LKQLCNYAVSKKKKKKKKKERKKERNQDTTKATKKLEARSWKRYSQNTKE
jgi:hypothetical protein